MEDCSYNCKKFPDEVEPYGDISGLGVVLGFTIMAWIAIILLIAYYVLAFDPRVDPFQNVQDADNPSLRSPNPVDASIFKYSQRLRSCLGLRPDNNHIVENAFNMCILALADTQLVTGIAIMVSGYYSLSCGLSAYHWKTILYLAWFSCLTHLSALTCLRAYLNVHETARAWRLSLMSALLVLVFVGFIPTGHFNFEFEAEKISPSAPAACFFKSGMIRGSEAFVSMVLSLLLLVYGYVVRVSKLFRISSTNLSHLFQGLLDQCHEKCLSGWTRCLRKLWPSIALGVAAVCIPLETSLYFTLKMFSDMYSSMLLDVISLVVSGIWGSLRLTQVRYLGPEDENNWTFGQVIPLVLLGIPALSIYELIFTYFALRGRSLSIDNESEVLLSATRAERGEFFPIQSSRKLIELVSPIAYSTRILPHRMEPEDDRSTDIPAIQVMEFHSMAPRAAGPNPSLSESISLRTIDSVDTYGRNYVEHSTSATYQYEILERPSDAENHQAEAEAIAEVISMIQHSRDAYKALWGFSVFLAPFASMLLLVILILILGASVFASWVFITSNVRQLLVDIFLFAPFCCLSAVMSLIHLESSCVKGKVKSLARFVLCVGFSCMSLTAMLNDTIIWIGYTWEVWAVASILISHVACSLFWATVKLRSLRGRRQEEAG
ncbi:hypothetical protein FOVG_19643 [Fusarium oxysporum f. sp. pisi HDV247]|uniref:Uncharacterized protein n=2 Tax=Fusarium oxysporum f. sp. pisi HDV247 TaxID=1080344 RepID=W9NDI0_FUSOX|nr:hypothetical protein FOVG_19643 [Fusarium oxysporum f. sp. pisi HDV247]